ncbi:MAG: excinuclease ABC subunit UvrC [Betaproteobacteria bacterium]|nr:excinuclease ABC subunit UvrC [Betaproteobacteria bacterium]
MAQSEGGAPVDEVLAHLPHRPGVYRMLAASGDVLYVGKALDLKKRVSSYFQKTGTLSPRIQVMVSQVAAIDTTVTRSESEALLLENNLIKSLRPRYNILYRDDKSYPFLVVTGHRFPRLAFHRGALDKANRYFGPFPHASAVRESIQLLQKVFRIRTCRDTVFSNRSRPCLLHQIHRCTAPCVGLVSEEDYAADVRNAALFLEGRQDEVLQSLAGRMEEAAQEMAYEEAAEYRDKIRALKAIRGRQYVTSASARDADVVAVVRDKGMIAVNLVMIRAGIHRGDRTYFPQNALEDDEQDAVEAFLVQHYLDNAAPPFVYVNRGFETEALVRLLNERQSGRVQIQDNATGERRVWVEMAEQNARLAIAQRVATQQAQESRLAALQRALGLPETVQRIECFDISHTMGEATVASCVVYDRGQMCTSDYRRFNISGVTPGDDYGAMEQALERRYRRLVNGEGRLPDLLLIDGGRGQLSRVMATLERLGVNDVPVVGVAKGEERKPGMEQLIIAETGEILHLEPDDPALHLIQEVRDEAHRFAITGHRARRAKARTRSSLESIEGIGAKRRQRLLARFGGLKGVIAASVDELAQVDGISHQLAERIYQQLH